MLARDGRDSEQVPTATDDRSGYSIEGSASRWHRPGMARPALRAASLRRRRWLALPAGVDLASHPSRRPTGARCRWTPRPQVVPPAMARRRCARARMPATPPFRSAGHSKRDVVPCAPLDCCMPPIRSKRRLGRNPIPPGRSPGARCLPRDRLRRAPPAAQEGDGDAGGERHGQDDADAARERP